MGPSRGPKWSIEIFEDDSSCDGTESRDSQTPDLVDRDSEGVGDSEREQSDRGPPSPEPYDGGVPALLEGPYEGDGSYKSPGRGDVVESIEVDHPLGPNSYSRNVSATTAVHLDDQLQDPFEEDNRRTSDYGRDLLHRPYDDDEDDGYNHCDVFSGRGPLSETFSALPEELELPDGINYNRPSSPVDDIRTPTSRRYRSGPGLTSNLLSEEQKSTPRSRKAQHSSPRYYEQFSPQSRTSSVQHHPQAFRNPSSVIAMQLSSPSPPPFVHSSRSGRHKRSSTSISGTKWRNGSVLRHNPDYSSTPVRSTPTRSHSSQKKKEHPLILLHCSISHLALPYSPTVLQAVLPQWIQQNEMLLREKLGPTVLDRGLLVPHPGEDYEVLEERILESLELKSPRVGKCGHFLGDGKLIEYSSQANKDESIAREENTSVDNNDDAFKDPLCQDCNRHIATGTHGTSNCQDHLRQWDVRVYASNGLMRAGAWSAAWREMEMVDVEVGVWIPETMRRSLEQEATQEWEEQERLEAELRERGDATDALAGENAKRSWSGQIPPPVPEVGMHRAAHRPSNSRDGPSQASTAACSRRSSANRPSSSHSWTAHGTREQLPLSTLMINFLKRCVRQRPDIILALSLMALGIAYLLRTPDQTAIQKDMINNRGLAPIPVVNVEPPVSTVSVAIETPLHNPSQEKLEKKALPMHISACTFQVDDAEEQGMTALPANLAKDILQAITATTTPLSSSTALHEEPSETPAEIVAMAEESPNQEAPLEFHVPKEESIPPPVNNFEEIAELV